MKDIRLALPIILLILIVILFAGCKSFVPSPGVTEDEATIIGQVKMPYCCLLLDEMEAKNKISKYSGYDCYDETDIWRTAPEAVVELRKMDGKCKKPEYHTETDETGYYEFTDVEPGMYVLTTYCPTDEEYFLKDVVEKVDGEALNAGLPDCDSTALALIIEYISGEYCHCDPLCPCFPWRWPSVEYKLIQKIAEDVNMEVNIPAIIAHEDFGDLCDDNGDLVDLVCEKLQVCCVSGAGTTNGGGVVCISLSKEVNADCYTPGSILTYTLSVTNTGDFNFSQVILTDDLLGLDENIGSLSTGASWSDDFTYDVPQDFVGTLVNHAEATGTYSKGTVSDEAEVIVSILECINDKPVISNLPPAITQQVNLGETYSYDVDAADPDGDKLTYSLTNKPSGMTIDSSTGVITWIDAQCYADIPMGMEQSAGDRCHKLCEVEVTVKVTDERICCEPLFDEKSFIIEVWQP